MRLIFKHTCKPWAPHGINTDFQVSKIFHDATLASDLTICHIYAHLV